MITIFTIQYFLAALQDSNYSVKYFYSSALRSRAVFLSAGREGETLEFWDFEIFLIFSLSHFLIVSLSFFDYGTVGLWDYGTSRPIINLASQTPYLSVFSFHLSLFILFAVKISHFPCSA